MEQEKNSLDFNTATLEEIRALLDDYPTQRTKPETEHVPPKQEDAQREMSREQEPVKQRDRSSRRSRVEPLPIVDEPKGTAFEVYSVLHDIIYILAVVTVLFVFFFRLVGVDGTSMLPTLHNRDYLLLESNFLYQADDVKNGDIVVLNVPYYEKEGPIVKRVIATEGQTVVVNYEKNCVTVDGVPLQEDYILPEAMHEIWDEQYALQYPATVPKGCIFVLGDNRNNSSDSRFALVGMIDKRYILGKVQLLLLPGQTKDAAGNVIDPRQWDRIGKVS